MTASRPGGGINELLGRTSSRDTALSVALKYGSKKRGPKEREEEGKSYEKYEPGQNLGQVKRRENGGLDLALGAQYNRRRVRGFRSGTKGGEERQKLELNSVRKSG